jgi:hypothetical protein
MCLNLYIYLYFTIYLATLCIAQCPENVSGSASSLMRGADMEFVWRVSSAFSLSLENSGQSLSNVTRHGVVTCRAEHRQAKHVSLCQLLCSIFGDLDDCSLYYICVFTQTARKGC